MAPSASEVKVEKLAVSAFTIPSEPEQDGTLTWNRTTLVVVEVTGGGRTELGFTYADKSVATLVAERFPGLVEGTNVFDVQATWWKMYTAIPLVGRPGRAGGARAAVDFALWDLKARILELPLVKLLGQVRDRIDIYASGGFTNYVDSDLQNQLRAWVEGGISRVKMKVGARPENDIARVGTARDAIGPMTELYVDANGAYDRKNALHYADEFYRLGVTWFEEPVSSDDLEGLRLLRDRAPGGMEIAAGEYGYDQFYFRRMLEAGAVDVLQIDATRAGGVTGFLEAAALCHAWAMPLSAHTAPTLHTPLCCAVQRARHLEYFHDHVRIENRLFEGVPQPEGGALLPRLDEPGFGIRFKRADASRYAA